MFSLEVESLELVDWQRENESKKKNKFRISLTFKQTVHWQVYQSSGVINSTQVSAGVAYAESVWQFCSHLALMKSNNSKAAEYLENAVILFFRIANYAQPQRQHSSVYYFFFFFWMVFPHRFRLMQCAFARCKCIHSLTPLRSPLHIERRSTTWSKRKKNIVQFDIDVFHSYATYLRRVLYAGNQV